MAYYTICLIFCTSSKYYIRCKNRRQATNKCQGRPILFTEPEGGIAQKYKEIAEKVIGKVKGFAPSIKPVI